MRSAVADLAARWKDLGISLGIRLSELNAICSANPHSPNDCLREMLASWLKQNYYVRTNLIIPCPLCVTKGSSCTGHINSLSSYNLVTKLHVQTQGLISWSMHQLSHKLRHGCRVNHSQASYFWLLYQKPRGRTALIATRLIMYDIVLLLLHLPLP